MIQLGQKVKDVVSGFTGIVVCRTEWMNGCVRVTVAPKATKSVDGAQELKDSHTFDEEQLQVVDAKPIALPGHKTPPTPAVPVRTGGGRPDPASRRDPGR